MCFPNYSWFGKNCPFFTDRNFFKSTQWKGSFLRISVRRLRQLPQVFGKSWDRRPKSGCHTILWVIIGAISMGILSAAGASRLSFLHFRLPCRFLIVNNNIVDNMSARGIVSAGKIHNEINWIILGNLSVRIRRPPTAYRIDCADFSVFLIRKDSIWHCYQTAIRDARKRKILSRSRA